MRKPPVVGPSLTPCLVCGSDTPCAYSGVNSCRACADFFKRSVLHKRKFVCRRGNGKCPIKKNVKFSCRRCRYDRCIEVGMKCEYVDEAVASSSTSNTIQPTTESTPETLLDNLIVEYRKFFDRRKEHEDALRISHEFSGCVVTVPGRTEVLHISTTDFEINFTPIAGVETVHFLNRTFPQFRALPTDQKRSVFKCFAPNLFNIEAFYRTNLLFPGNARYYCSRALHVFDNEELEQSFPDDLVGEKRKAAAKALLHYNEAARNIVMPSMERADLSERELVAAIAILLWSFEDAPCIPVDVQIVGEGIISEILRTLNEEYRKDKKNPSERIGKIMSVVHAVKESSNLNKEEFRVYGLMDLFRYNSYMAETFMR